MVADERRASKSPEIPKSKPKTFETQRWELPEMPELPKIAEIEQQNPKMRFSS